MVSAASAVILLPKICTFECVDVLLFVPADIDECKDDAPIVLLAPAPIKPPIPDVVLLLPPTTADVDPLAVLLLPPATVA